MGNKNVYLLLVFSLIACALHATILHTPFNDYAFTSAFKVVVFILFPILYFAFSKDGNIKDLLSFFSLKNAKNIKFALILGAGVFAVIVVAFIVLQPLFDRVMVIQTLENNGITPGNAIFVFLYIVIINAALEQFFFRGFVFMTLYSKGLKRFAHAFSSILFSVYHIPIIYNAVSPGILILCTVGLIVAGLIFNFLTVKCNSIIGSLIVHISANLALNLMIGIYFVFV